MLWVLLESPQQIGCYGSEFVIFRLWRGYWILSNLCHWKFNENLKIQLTLVGSQARLVHSMPQGLFCPNYIYIYMRIMVLPIESQMYVFVCVCKNITIEKLIPLAW
jgi:hypothetical protein